MIRTRIGVAALVVVAGLAAAVGLSLSSANEAEATAGKGAVALPELALSAGEMPAALEAAIAAFPYDLPVGQSWPDSEVLFSGEETDVYHDGVSEMNVALYWQCAWSGAVLSAANEGDSGAVSTGVAQLEKWGTIPAVEQWVSVSDIEAWHRTELAPALAGDFTNMRTAHGGCNGFGFK